MRVLLVHNPTAGEEQPDRPALQAPEDAACETQLDDGAGIEFRDGGPLRIGRGAQQAQI